MTALLHEVRGARAAEELLLEALELQHAESRADPALLARPVRVLVPSRSLRLHLTTRIVQRLRATAGIQVQTLFSAALEILHRSRVTVRGGDLLFELLTRREARGASELAAALEPLKDGYRPVASSVRDLLDAGLESAHVEALRECVKHARVPAAVRARALEVAGVAERTLEELARRGAHTNGGVMARALRALQEAPERAFPARALFVHGFADVTGRNGDLLFELVRVLDGRVLLVRPDDPAAPSQPDPGNVFAERFRERACGPARAGNGQPVRVPTEPALACFRAPGAVAEARAVARRIRGLLEHGVAPESIAIVARDLAAHESALGIQLERLGIPFSSPRARAAVDGAARAILALVELVLRRDRCPADRWLDATRRLTLEREGKAERLRPSADYLLALRAAGGARLAEAAALEVDSLLDERGNFELPSRAGLWQEDEEEDATTGEPRERKSVRATFRRVKGDDLRSVVAAARQVRGRFERWRASATFQDHAAELERLRRGPLGWHARDEADRRLSVELAGAAEELGDEPLSFDEFCWWLERSLVPAARPELGGAGGGVALLDAMSARGRTFEHLFLIGLNRDAFPRVAREDALLPDELRGDLRALLPDVPIKGRARDEDRYLFAALLSAADQATLSWQTTDEDGKGRVLSPLVDRLVGARGLAVVDEPGIFALEPEPPGARPALEHAVLAGLRGGPGALDGRLAVALDEAGVPRAERAGEARVRVLETFESRSGPLPWFGFIGSQAEIGLRPDPDVDPPYVTRIERGIKCPWQLVLQRFLGLESSSDPLEALPGFDARLLGIVVHEVLQRVAQQSLGERAEDLAAALRGSPVRCATPEPSELEALLARIARQALADAGVREEGVVRMLCARARPQVASALALLADELEHSEEGGCLGVELHGRAVVPRAGERTATIQFKVDRVDRLDDRLLLTDFKTGNPFKAKELEKKLKQGDALQPAAYALAASGEAPKVRGRLVFLRSDVERDGRVVDLREEGEDWRAPVGAAVASLLDVWRAGAFFPRLTEPDGEKSNKACKFCDVRQACIKEDSSARRQLVELAHGTERSSAFDALRALWNLPEPERRSRR